MFPKGRPKGLLFLMAGDGLIDCSKCRARVFGMAFAQLGYLRRQEYTMQASPLISTRGSQHVTRPQAASVANADTAFALEGSIVDVPGATPRSALRIGNGEVLLLPTPANAALMAKKAGDLLRDKMQAAGMSLTPDFTLKESGQPPTFKVAGQRQDSAAIEAMIKEDQGVSRALHNASAVASHLPALAAASSFSEAWQQTKTDTERQALWQYYQATLATLRSDVQLEMRNGQMSVSVNGEEQTA